MTGATPGRGRSADHSAVLDRIADQFSDHDALVTDDRRSTFANCATEVRRAAAAMIALGVSPGDRVAIWSPNTWHWVVGVPGHPLRRRGAGAVEHPLHRHEAADILARTGAPLLVAAGGFLGPTRPRTSTAMRCRRCGTSSASRSRRTTAPGTTSCARGTDLDAVDARAAAVKPDDVADILFTSGTTGRSKGAMCAHRQSLDAPAAWAECGRVTSDDRYLWSTRSSTPSATRPASWSACRPGRRSSRC